MLHLHQDFPFLADVSKESPSAATAAEEAQAPSAGNCNVHSIRTDSCVCEGVAGCNVLLRHPDVLHSQLSPNSLLGLACVRAKEAAGAACAHLTHHQHSVVCLSTGASVSDAIWTITTRERSYLSTALCQQKCCN